MKKITVAVLLVPVLFPALGALALGYPFAAAIWVVGVSGLLAYAWRAGKSH